MRHDPALCRHTDIRKTVKIETISVPELELEQLVLRVRVYCRDCKEAFVPKTMAMGFSTEEVGVVGDEVFIPLEYPQTEEEGESDVEPATQAAADEPRPPKDHLH